MKAKTCILLTALAALLIVAGLASAAGTEDQGGASAYVAAPNYEFPPVLEGIDVIHDYVVRNEGTAPLTIDNVKTG